MLSATDRPRRRYRRQTATPTPPEHPLEHAWTILQRQGVVDPLRALHDLSWVLLLRLLSASDASNAPYRWCDWAAPDGPTRLALQQRGEGALLDFVNDELFPQLLQLRQLPSATPQQRLMCMLLREDTRLGTVARSAFCLLLDTIHQITPLPLAHNDSLLCQNYHQLLDQIDFQSSIHGLKTTPAAISQAIAQALDLRDGEAIYDPACGTGDLLAAAYTWKRLQSGELLTDPRVTGAAATYCGREPNRVYAIIALVRLLLAGIPLPQLCCDDAVRSDDAFIMHAARPDQVDVVLATPPFGGRAMQGNQHAGGAKTAPVPLLFLQHAMASLRPGGRCGIVLPEGILGRTDELVLIQTRQTLLETCDLWCVVSLPIGAFPNTDAKTNILLFTAGRPTSRIWYYDLSWLKIGKKCPLRQEHFAEFLALLPTRADGAHSWTVERQAIERNGYRLNALHPQRAEVGDQRTPEELLDLIDDQEPTFRSALAQLRAP